jgi:hypothetical protein
VTADGSRAEWLEEKHAQLNGPLPEPVVSPKRIQLKRTKGFRKPEGAIVVARPSKWGNPFNFDGYREQEWTYPSGAPFVPSVEVLREWAARDFRRELLDGHLHSYPSTDEIIGELAGCDLACWCAVYVPCHADVLLEIANGGVS